jgi:superfamily II helicase
MTGDQLQLVMPGKDPIFTTLLNSMLKAYEEQDFLCSGCGNRDRLNRMPDRLFKCSGSVVVCGKCGKEQGR